VCHTAAALVHPEDAKNRSRPSRKSIMIRNTAVPLLALFAAFSTGPAAKAQEVLLDYRDPAFSMGSPFYSEAEKRTVAEAIGADGPDDVKMDFAKGFVLLGDREGRFAPDGEAGRVFLVQGEAPVAIEPFPQAPAPTLVVLRDDAPPSFHRLPADVQYQRLVAVADVDADGMDEAFLETSFMNMGQLVTSLSIAKLGDGTEATILGEPQEVSYDGCENPAGERARRAATVSIDGGLLVEQHEQPCD
jgi:hypothetical protein